MKRILFFLLLLIPFYAQAESNATQQSAKAEFFVKSFYDWYLQEGKDRSVDDILKYKKHLLSHYLYKLLKAERDAQAKSPGEIVGLDFDPFLAGQDVAQKYEFGKSVTKNGSEWIGIYGIWNGKKSKKPDLTAEIQCNSSCIFVNFHYDSNSNLISLLKNFKYFK